VSEEDRVNWIRSLFGILILSCSPSLANEEIVVVSGPEIFNVAAVPLARTLELETNLPSRVHVAVTDGEHGWQRWLGGSFETVHRLPLLGFKPGRTYQVAIRLEDEKGATFGIPGSMAVTTNDLPGNFPPIEIQSTDPARMEPGLLLFGNRNMDARDGFTMVLDQQGDVVWYIEEGLPNLRQLDNGLLLIGAGNQNEIFEMTLLGERVRTWNASLSGNPAPSGSIPIDVSGFHHEVFPTSHGTILTLHRTPVLVDEYPTSETDPNAPTAPALVLDEPGIEFDPATGTILHEWSPLAMLDPHRIGYGSTGDINDWAHANAIIHDERDDSVIISLRHQDTVYKIDRQTGALKWILAPHDNWGPEWQSYLLAPVGALFEWSYHQHAPMVTPRGTLLIYDNGNFRASPFDTKLSEENNYSRAVEYEIDEERMEIRQVWAHGIDAGPRVFSFGVGDADWLSKTGNVLITHGAVRVMDGLPTPAVETRIVEVDHSTPPREVLAISIRDNSHAPVGWLTYRSEKIRDLYADLDGDGFSRESDCNDDRADVSPLGIDLPGDFSDQDCSGKIRCDPCMQWNNHGEFVSCVARESSLLRHSGAISEDQLAGLVRHAAGLKIHQKASLPATCTEVEESDLPAEESFRQNR
jgi:arylsulfate sulfotransferase